jgi:hypothetical protein
MSSDPLSSEPPTVEHVEDDPERFWLDQVDSLKATVQRLTQQVETVTKDASILANEVTRVQALLNAFDEGQAAALRGAPQSANPHDPGDSYDVPLIWQMWDDGYLCCSHKRLAAEVTRLTAERDKQRRIAEMERRALERLNLCSDHRDKAAGLCIVCQAEHRTRDEYRGAMREAQKVCEHAEAERDALAARVVALEATVTRLGETPTPSRIQALEAENAQLRRVTDLLFAEFSGQVNAGAGIRDDSQRVNWALEILADVQPSGTHGATV